MAVTMHNMHNLPKHYHIEGRLPDEFGTDHHFRTSALPQEMAREDIRKMANEHHLPLLSNGSYGDPEMLGTYLVLMPCMRSTEESNITEQGWRLFGGKDGSNVREQVPDGTPKQEPVAWGPDQVN